jgi:aspartyl-tRNA(Asn)/glutamyl-tRNA(Gln) amidotransferase subunit A
MHSSMPEGLRALRDAIADGRISAVEAARHHLDRITRLDPTLGAYLTVDADGALTQAEGIDARRRAGEPLGALAGVPIGLKDNLLTRGLRTTCGSRMLERFVPPCDATVVQRLRAAGAVVLGKLNLDEFAMGSSTENSAFQVTRNPWDLRRAPGGQQRRQRGGRGGGPLCGRARYGHRRFDPPTRVVLRHRRPETHLRAGEPLRGRRFCQQPGPGGPHGVDVRDTAILFEAIAGVDPQDSTSADVPRPADRARRAARTDVPLTGVRIGWPTGVRPRRRARAGRARPRCDAALARLRATRRRDRARLARPCTQHAIATYYLVATAEASSNLARFDGVRFGHRTPDAETLEALYAGSRGGGIRPGGRRGASCSGPSRCRPVITTRSTARPRQVRALIRSRLREGLRAAST